MAYDIITVGSGGSGSLTAAAYLAVSGKKVLVLERNEWLGGGVVTREVTAPGFKHDIHSTCHISLQANPLILNDELGLLSKFGLEYIYPENCFSTIFEDGTSVITYRDVEKTCDSFAKISKHDADAYRRFAAYAERILPLVVAGLYSPPPSVGGFTAFLDQNADGRELITNMHKSSFDIVEEWFESEKIKIHLLKMASESLAGPEEKGTGLTLFFLSGFVHNYPMGIPVGGSGALTNALVKCIEHHGGEVRTNADVVKVTVKDGRATGVILKTGEAILAEDAVIGAIHPYNLGDIVEGVPEDLSQRAKKVQMGAFSAMNSHYALRRAPRFNTPDPDASTAVCVELMTSDLDTFRREFDHYRYGELPQSPTYCICVHTNHDPTRAPDGQHTMWLYTFMPYDLADGGAEKWDSIKEDVADMVLEGARKFTDDLGPDNIIARAVDSPLDISRHSPSFQKGDLHGAGPYTYQFFGFRPIPELGQYTVPNIDRLYLAGPFMHPMGGVFCGGRATAMKAFDELGMDFDKVVSIYGNG